MFPSSVSYDHIQGVMALTLFEDFVYWTDGKSKSLRRAHKTTGAQGMELLNSWQAIKSIKVYHSLRQPEGTKSICHLVFILLSHNEQLLQASYLVLRRKLFMFIHSLNSVMSFCFSVQYPSTSVRLQTEDAATCVFYPPAENTNVPVPRTFTWRPTTRPASPTALLVRSAISPPTSKFRCTRVMLLYSDQYFSAHEQIALLQYTLLVGPRKCLCIDFGFEES